MDTLSVSPLMKFTLDDEVCKLRQTLRANITVMTIVGLKGEEGWKGGEASGDVNLSAY